MRALSMSVQPITVAAGWRAAICLLKFGGDRGESLGRQIERLANHLVHALAGALLNALHQRDDECGIWNEPFEFLERAACVLRGDGHDDHVGMRNRFGSVAGRLHIVRQFLHARQTHRIPVLGLDCLHDLRLDRPHHHIVARIGKHLTEGGSPRAGAQNCDIRHAYSLLETAILDCRSLSPSRPRIALLAQIRRAVCRFLRLTLSLFYPLRISYGMP